MEFVVYGVDFLHRKGEFCVRTVSEFFFVSHFRTDFLVEIDGKMIRGAAGDMLMMPPGSVIYHGPTEDMDIGFRNDWLYVGGDDFSSLLEKYPLPQKTPFQINRGKLLANAIDRIHKEKSFALEGMRDQCDLVMTEMIIDVFREYTRSVALERTDTLEYVRKIVMKDAKKPWTLASLAELSGYSPSRFSVLYKEKYGSSPIADLISFRIENAKRLLLYSNMTVIEISEAVGFSSIYYFSKHFKKLVGVCPTAYQKHHKNTIP